MYSAVPIKVTMRSGNGCYQEMEKLVPSGFNISAVPKSDNFKWRVGSSKIFSGNFR